MRTLAILPPTLAWLFRFMSDPDSWVLMVGLLAMWSLWSPREI